MVQDKDKEGGPGKSYEADCEKIAQRAAWLLASAQAVQDKATAAVKAVEDLGPKVAGRRDSMLASLETMLDADYVGADLRKQGRKLIRKAREVYRPLRTAVTT